MIFTASMLATWHYRDSEKTASSSVVSLGKALYGISSSLCDRQRVGLCSLPVVVAQSY